MTGNRWPGLLAIVAVAIGIGYSGFNAYRSSQTEQCYACQRAVHAHSRTVAILRGKPRTFCCPACALSEHEQEAKPVRVTELTAYSTGAKLSPNDAFIVKGSDVNMCVQKRELMDAEKRPADLHYDRCSPSLIAFAKRSEAEQFVREHGGEVLSFTEVASAFGR